MSESRVRVGTVMTWSSEGASSALLQIRVGGDADGVTTTLVEAGAELVAAPVEAPWRSLNSRLDAPAGLQITFFEEFETPQERATRPGF